MTAYTRLERAVMDALASELGPDFARQFAASRLTVRRNSGFGLFTEMAVDPALVTTGATGEFGTVHAMVAGLQDPIAFTARLQDGRLVGLMGDSYGQDTRAIDFTSVHVSQIFTVDASGRSVPFQSALALPPDSQARPQPSRSRSPTAAPTSQASPSLVRVARPEDLKTLVEAARQGSDALKIAAADAGRSVRPLEPSGATPVDGVTLLIGAWTVLAVVAILVGLFTDVPWPALLIAVFWIGAALRKPKARAALQRGVETWNTARAAERG
ncbi:MAG: hypothetical protein EON90_02580 [Brevundimonas sp.]|nr:MAG: hypothetical protein EON90_02580 [Brevundimonas sp.]